MSPAPRILALDLATKTGVADGRPGEIPILSTVSFGGRDDDHLDVCAHALKWIALRLADDRPDVVYIEAPMPVGAAMRGNSSASSIVRLNTLYGIFGAAAMLKAIRVQPLDVQDVRKAFLGNGRLKSDEAKRRAHRMARLIGWAPRTLDEADAAALWWLASWREAPTLAVKVHPGMHKQIVRQRLI